MEKVKWLYFKKTIGYEFDYLFRKFKISQAFIFLFSLIVLVIISLNDTQSFFTGETSPIPQAWYLLKNEAVATTISIAIIVVSYLLPWITDFLRTTREASELSMAIAENLVPAIGIELQKLKTNIKRKFKLDDDIRLSIFVPVRKSKFQWYFQMVCRTDNVPDRELLAWLRLDEGVIGYTFLKNQKHNMEFIDVSNTTLLPSTYVPLTRDNENLINRNIKGVIVAAAFQEGSIAGLLAIDTDNLVNIIKMEDKSIHDDALDWIIARSKAVRLLWRMKNNV